MAIWVKQRNKAVRVRSWSLLRFAVAVSVATAILIPVTYDLMSEQGQDVTKRALLAGCVIVVGAALAPWTSLTMDVAKRRIDWHRVGVWRRRTVAAGLDDVAGLTLIVRPDLGWICGYRLRIDTKLGAWYMPLGWSWRRTLQRRADEALQAVRAALSGNVAETGAASVTADRPKLRISLRRLMLATALGAVVLGVSKTHFWSAVNSEAPVTMLAAILIVAAALLYRPGSAVTERFLLAPIVMYGPLLWIVAENRPWGATSGLYDTALVFPAIWIAVFPFLRGSPDSMIWPAAIAVLLELAISLEAARRGWKWTLPWIALLALVSLGASIIIYAGSKA